MTPFFIIFKMAKLPGVGHAVNTILLSFVLSAYYASTHTLIAMGREGSSRDFWTCQQACCTFILLGSRHLDRLCDIRDGLYRY